MLFAIMETRNTVAQLPTKWEIELSIRVDAYRIDLAPSINYYIVIPLPPPSPVPRRQVARVINAIAIIYTGRNNTVALLLQLHVKAYRGLKSISSFPPFVTRNKCKIILI